MKIREVIQEEIEGSQIQRVSSQEVVLTDPESGIETRIPKKANEPGTIKRDKQGKLVLDTETPGGVAADIEPGEDITIDPGSAEGTQGTTGTA
jgi:hypothetical protein